MSSFLSGGTSTRIDQHEPPTPGPHPAILLLHGSGGNVRFWSDRVAPHLTRLNIALYAVHYFDRTGTTRAYPENILDGYHFPAWLSTISDGLAYIRARPKVDSSRVALLGISLGAFLSLALATDPAARIRAVVEISGGLPDPYAIGATSAFPPTLILHGTADTVVPVTYAQQLDKLLTRLAVPHDTHLFPNQGHWFDAPAQLRILLTIAQFLAQRL
jgi:carboxymethylenebutenolidase